ncbi:MAG TPA: peptide ABC transporter ATP-binding protein [Micromonosporaceae bacterium]|nr:peptide ABC transporter ATP-binding protein [Micromonosporaceae bacterium]HCU51892.1 peptide ABC transporter ATP-binding protein [Micromonosporaceae bacterium]
MTVNALLGIENVVVDYPAHGWRRTPMRALTGVSLNVQAGETVGLVGESGSGKTTLGRAILGLVPITAGQITYRDRVISGLGKRARRMFAGQIQVVFQDPYSSLNPAMTVSDILTEPIIAAGVSRQQAETRVRDLLDQVRLPANAGQRLPREFSGGQRQRIAIARALAMKPMLIVCDEPVSALDLSTQARVLEILKEIQQRTSVAYLFISHDLSVVRHISHRVAVMYRGSIVETGDADVVTRSPQHPYTRRLLMAAPIPNPQLQAQKRAARLASAVVQLAT